MISQRQVVAIIPAAGNATRLSPLPCSKELYPVGFYTGEDGIQRPKVVSQYLIEKLKHAGIKSVFFSLRKGKADIMDYFGDGSSFGVDIAYLVTSIPYGVPYTIDRAYHFLNNDIVALGFPDILFDPDDAFSNLLARQAERQADVVLGLFPADRPDKCDMVETDKNGIVKQIVIKPKHTSLTETWGIAVWTPSFSRYMHEFLKTHLNSGATEEELFIGDVIQAATKEGFYVDTVTVSKSPFIDIGTPEDLAKALNRYFPST